MNLEISEPVFESELKFNNNIMKSEIPEDHDEKEEKFCYSQKKVEDLNCHKQEAKLSEESENFLCCFRVKSEPDDDEISIKEEVQDAESLDSSNLFLQTDEPSKSSSLSDNKRTNRFLCIFCNKPYDYLSHLKNHMRIHSGVKPYTCEVCSKNFRCKGTLKVHLLTHTGSKPFKCQVCQKEFQTSSNLKKHNLIHTDQRPYSCDICHRKYRCVTQMKNHRMHKHLGEKKYHCSFCPEKFGYSVSLKAHLLNHTGEALPFKCDVCNKNFKMSHHLKRHKETHIGAPFVCRACTEEFLQLRELQKHSSVCQYSTFGNLDCG